jgi:hypothetical protein
VVDSVTGENCLETAHGHLKYHSYFNAEKSRSFLKYCSHGAGHEIFLLFKNGNYAGLWLSQKCSVSSATEIN